MIDNVRSYIGCGRPWAEDVAVIVCETHERYEAGEISEDELKEILLDVVRINETLEDADDIEIRNGLITAIAIVGKFA
jgi:hypothetical protein